MLARWSPSGDTILLRITINRKTIEGEVAKKSKLVSFHLVLT
jgi:hypothetical protein